MGYRHYLGVIDKDKLEEFRNNFSKIEENCEYVFCIGKLYHGDTKDIKDALYKDKEDLLPEWDIEMFICPQDIFLNLANIYMKKTKKYLEDLFKPFLDKGKGYGLDKRLTLEQKTKLFEVLRDIEGKIYIFNNNEFKDEGKDIGMSWLYEYLMFNLIHIHKTIDFEKQVVICFAY